MLSQEHPLLQKSVTDPAVYKSKGVRKYANHFLTKLFPEEVIICTALVIATFSFFFSPQQMVLLRLVSIYFLQGESLRTSLCCGRAWQGQGHCKAGSMHSLGCPLQPHMVGESLPSKWSCQRSQKTFHRAFNSPIDFRPTRKLLCYFFLQKIACRNCLKLLAL